MCCVLCVVCCVLCVCVLLLSHLFIFVCFFVSVRLQVAKTIHCRDKNNIGRSNIPSFLGICLRWWSTWFSFSKFFWSAACRPQHRKKGFSCRVVKCFGGFGYRFVFEFLSSLQFCHSSRFCYLRCFVFFLGGSFFIVCCRLCYIVFILSVVWLVWTQSWFDQEADQITESPSPLFLFLMFCFIVLTSVLTPHNNLVFVPLKTRKEHEKIKQKYQKMTPYNIPLLGGVSLWSIFYVHILLCCLWSTYLLYCFYSFLFCFYIVFFDISVCFAFMLCFFDIIVLTQHPLVFWKSNEDKKGPRNWERKTEKDLGWMSVFCRGGGGVFVGLWLASVCVWCFSFV